MKGKKIIIPALVLSLVGGAGILATLNQSSAPVSNTSKTTTQVSSTDKSKVEKTKESSSTDKSKVEKTKESSSTEQSSATSTTDSNQSSTQSIASQSQATSTVAESSKTEGATKVATESKVAAETVTTEISKENPPISQETLDKLSKTPTQAGQKVMLNVRPQIQRAWNTCAPTTVSMMLSYSGIEVSQEVLAQEMGTDNTFGTHNANAIQILNRHLFGYDYPQSNQPGYRLATVTTSDVHSEQMNLFKQRLRQNIADGYPMYYTFDSSKIYPGLRGEHNVIGIGYQLTEDGSDIAYLYYLDPSPNVQDPVYGGLKKVSPQELFESMLTCVEPNYGW